MKTIQQKTNVEAPQGGAESHYTSFPDEGKVAKRVQRYKRSAITPLSGVLFNKSLNVKALNIRYES
ncbi:MAG: hypothetical protein LBR10_14770 [Prevotellaceae bacterium]|jgi:hypothetical protein|nr:hypothetical protein [Prevotellaceae bacterium]